MTEIFYGLLKGKAHLAAYDIKAAVSSQNVMHLCGEVEEWQHVVDIGHLAGSIKGVKGVVNNITAKNAKVRKADNSKRILEANRKGVIGSADIVIVGGGITGCGIARELAKYALEIIVIEKNEDIAEGTTKANNGMVHSGYDSKTGSLKAKLNVKGNAMYSKWAEELNFHFVRSGSFVAGFDESDHRYIEDYYERGKANGVPGICILSGDEARELEPRLSKKIVSALWTPSAAYVEPYEVTLALAENAADNGVKFMLDTEALAIDVENASIKSVVTSRGIIHARYVINAAGVYADDIAEMAGAKTFTIHPRRGTLIVFDKDKKGVMTRFVGTPPQNYTKGGGPMETPEGNSLWGPSAVEVPDKEDIAVDDDDIESVITKGMSLIEGIDRSSVITYFSGVRASDYLEDFIIGPSETVKGFINAAAIQSPGLASSPAIAELVADILKQLEAGLEKKKAYNAIRPKPVCFRECTLEEQSELVVSDRKYGHIICRCETVTEAEIINAIHGKIPATTVDAVKRRTRAGMGRCQAGFCGPRAVELLAREMGKRMTDITQKGRGSELLLKRSRDMEDAGTMEEGKNDEGSI